MTQLPRTPGGQEKGLPSPEMQSGDNLNDLVAATKALAAQLQQTAAIRAEHVERGKVIDEQLNTEKQLMDESLGSTLQIIRRALVENRLDNQSAIRMWTEATGNETPTELIDKMNLIHEGVRLMTGDGWGMLNEGTATGETDVSLYQRDITATARVKESDRSIRINDDTLVGDEAIVSFLRQSLDECLSSQNPYESIVSFFRAKSRAEKIGVVVPGELQEAAHGLIGEQLKDDTVRLSPEDFPQSPPNLKVLRADALDSGKSDNIDLFLRRIDITKPDEQSRGVLREIGKAYDMADHGKHSVFAQRNFYDLPPEDILEHELRAEMNALARYKQLRVATEEA